MMIISNIYLIFVATKIIVCIISKAYVFNDDNGLKKPDHNSIFQFLVKKQIKLLLYNNLTLT